MVEVRQASNEAQRQRQLLLESPAKNVVRGWLTGECYKDAPVELQRRRPYRKTAARRPRRISG